MKILSNILYLLYGIKRATIRKLVIKLLCKLERGEIYSHTLRKIFKVYHKVEIGLFSHGGCFNLGQVHPYTKIGRYCSIARTAWIINRNHPMEFKSTHAMFCVALFKLCHKDLVEYKPLEIGNDVWIGHNAIITPQVEKIADGAVIAAGAVVNKNILPYAVVAGNPARIVRYRFSKEVIEELLKSKWWEKSIEEIKLHIKEFQQPYEKLYYDKETSIRKE